MEEKFSVQLERFAAELPSGWSKSLLEAMKKEAERRENWEENVNKELYAYLGIAL